LKQVIVRSGQVVVADVPEPSLEPGSLLVDVSASCISSGTELSGITSAGAPLWRRAARNPAKVKRAIEMVSSQGMRHTVSVVREQVSTGTVLGYSAAGRVRAVADDIDGFRPGDRVACAGAGIANHAAVARVPVNLAVHVPPKVSLPEASTVALGAIALQGVRRASPSLGETVVVIGLGAIGQLTVQLLKATGCRVLVGDVDPARVDLALARGADLRLEPDDPDPTREVAVLTAGAGADAVIITAASPSDEIVSRAFQVSRKKGRVVLVGDVGLGLHRSDFYAKELDFLISTSYGPGRYDRRYEEEGLDYPLGYVRWTENRNMEEFLRLVADGRVDVEPLVETRFPVGDAAKAYAALGAPGHRPLSAVLDYRQADAPARASGPKAEARAPRTKAGPARGHKVQLALVGAGSFALSMHVPNLRALGDRFQLRWVISRSGARAAELARQHGALSASTDLDDALSDGELDAVLVATNHDTHASIALRCLEAGKHVLVEKPLALRADELRSLQGFFDVNGSGCPVLMTGFNRRFSEHASKAAELLEDRQGPAVISYRVSAGWLPPDNWVYGPEGGGRNLGEACHMYDLFGFFTGARYSWLEAGLIGPPPPAYRRGDNFTASIGFEDGSLATLTYTSLGPSGYPKERCEIFCDGRVILLDDFKSTSAADARGSSSLASRADKGHRRELEAFAQCVQSGGEWPIPLWQQIQASEIALGIEEALRAAPNKTGNA
jgi:predicted dehydrogenase